MAEANSTPNGPWYVKTGLTLLNSAPWALLSVILLGLMTGWLPFPVLTAVIALRSDMTEMKQLLKSHDAVMASFAASQEEVIDVQRATCWNTSKTPEDQRRCYRTEKHAPAASVPRRPDGAPIP